VSRPDAPGDPHQVQTPAATVVICTHNRKEEVSKAIASCLLQTARPEVIVLDDASTDGTAADVRKRYPGIRLVAASVRQGPARLENLGISMARAEIVFQLDDDAEFTSEETVAQTLRLLDDRRVAVVGIPYVEPTVHNRVLQRAPDDGSVWVAATFVSCACALRKGVFTAVGGYRLAVDGQGEEEDVSIRMLDVGYVVRLGVGDPVAHYRSPLRSVTRMDLYGRKNDVLYAWHNVPSLFLAPHLAYRILQGVRMGIAMRRPWVMVKGLASGFRSAAVHRADRAPVRMTTYILDRRLRRAGATPLRAIEGELPLPSTLSGSAVTS
jgi:glycosyltransferase involved in cell wall biosynthesis